MDENKYPREFLISLKDGSDVVLAPLHVHGGAIVGPVNNCLLSSPHESVRNQHEKVVAIPQVIPR